MAATDIVVQSSSAKLVGLIVFIFSTTEVPELSTHNPVILVVGVTSVQEYAT